MNKARCLTMALLVLSCSSSAPPGTKEREVILTTEYDDLRAGEQGALDIEAEFGILDAPEITAYVREIGMRLVRRAPPRPFVYTFHVVDQAMPNAFALPGGHIYLSRGLLALANSEDEIACVLGHEITHAASRHAAGMQARMRTLNPFSIGFMRVLQLTKHGRDQERDADRGGQEMAARAGYDPMGMPNFLKDLDAIERFYMGWSRLPSFLATHPTTPERLATATHRVQTIAWTRQPGVTSDHEGFLQRIEGLTMGVNPAEGIFEGTRFLHPDLGFSVNFPEGFETRNTHQAVGAISLQGDAQVSITLAGVGDDPKVAADAFLSQRAPELRANITRVGPLTIGDLPAYRVEAKAPSASGSVEGKLTWIAFEGYVYQITALASAQVAEKYEGRMRSVPRSFRGITQGERDSVEIVRLRLARSRVEEPLERFLARTDNTLHPNLVAVANGLVLGQRLAMGRLLKIGISEPYVASSTEPPLMEIEGTLQEGAVPN